MGREVVESASSTIQTSTTTTQRCARLTAVAAAQVQANDLFDCRRGSLWLLFTCCVLLFLTVMCAPAPVVCDGTVLPACLAAIPTWVCGWFCRNHGDLPQHARALGCQRGPEHFRGGTHLYSRQYHRRHNTHTYIFVYLELLPVSLTLFAT